MTTGSSSTQKRRRTGHDPITKESDVSVYITNLDVPDCRICFEPLTIPVYQCKNGHVTCKTCCERLEGKCPTCGLQIDSKCRSLEEILESVKIPCKNKEYGCTDLISYCDRIDHEKNCIYESYPCPQAACDLRGSSNQLSDHFCARHGQFMKTFQYNSWVHLLFSKNPSIILLKERASGDLFVLNNTIANCDGNKISISFVKPLSLSGQVVEHTYELNVRKFVRKFGWRSVLKFNSFTRDVRSISDEHDAPALLNVSNEFLKLKNSLIYLKLCPVTESDGGNGILMDEHVVTLLEAEKIKVASLEKELESLRKEIESRKAVSTS